MKILAAWIYLVRCCTWVDELRDMVSTTLRGRETVGSCTIRPDEYDVDEDTSDVDNSEYDATSVLVASMTKEEEKRGGIEARAVVLCKPSRGERAEPYASAGASKRLAPC